jgi:hypothetical protein
MTMHATLKRCLGVFWVLLLSWPAAAIQRKGRAAEERQGTFGSEITVKRPAPVPGEILRRLIRENKRELQSCLETDGAGEADLRQYFVASALHLNGDGRLDLIVQPSKYCLQGAHNTEFWFFTSSGNPNAGGYKLSFSTRSDLLEVLGTSSHGYRDIRASGHTAIYMFSTTWRYDGRRYRPAVCTREDLETDKVVRVKCSPA